jgi:(1->4)-alpha-D-glucan 1-alpha-D-glucosylmutase
MTSARLVPRSTYRLQIRPSFSLEDARKVVDYVRDLGADWLYLSPVLSAASGSDHGYDVVDPTTVDSARGGPEALAELSRRAHEAGLGMLIDIVPNHMGVGDASQNPWWWDVLKFGRDSRYAEAFDIDWEHGGGKVRLPVLGTSLKAAVAAGELTIVGDEIRYFEHRFPIAPGTLANSIAATLDSQHYDLMEWRRESSELNYRRFFAVSSLAGVRVEVPWVFDETHREIVRWIRERIADGLRVDHIDGLADPTGYLDELARATSNTPVWVEKILEGDEQLPTFWATVGTTGYEALADFDRILVDPDGRAALDEIDTALRHRAQPLVWETLIHRTKRGVADSILRSEVLRIAGLVPQAQAQDADAISELLACFPVYRSYLPAGEECLRAAVKLASAHRPELATRLGELCIVLSDPREPAAIRFQQTSGMVMAKGVEDTAFYRYTRLTSLTEVGADPSEFSIGIAEFHRRQALRLASHPSSLTALTTHDTKHGEDARARISVLAEVPERWSVLLAELRARLPLGDGPFENLLWESMVGVWPASRERLREYARKAAREAGSSTDWSTPNPDFEQRMLAAVDAALDEPSIRELIDDFVASIEAAGWSNGLTQKLLQLAAPGIPDVYQGSELWETSLVDPDNRRAVDFRIRRSQLARIGAGLHPRIDASGAAKMLVTTRALRARRDYPELFYRYLPIVAVGPARSHVVAFDRGGAIALGTRLPVGLQAQGGWGDTLLLLPRGSFTDIIADREFEGGPTPAETIFADYPVALLMGCSS